MKFRKRPIIIEAEQYHFAQQPWPPGICLGAHDGMYGPHIHTLEGPLRVSDGDWIITGIEGEKYPCKPNIFEETYEAV